MKIVRLLEDERARLLSDYYDVVQILSLLSDAASMLLARIVKRGKCEGLEDDFFTAERLAHELAEELKRIRISIREICGERRSGGASR